MLSEQCPKLNLQSIKVPWFYLKEKAIPSKVTAFVISTIWMDAQNSEDQYCRLTNQEITHKSRIEGGEQAARYHLVKLEKAGYIKRYGANKNRLIEITIHPPDSSGLTIFPDILHLNISSAGKLIIAITRGFPDHPIKWKCDQLGISKWTYFTSVNPEEKTKGQLIPYPSKQREEAKCLEICDAAQECLRGRMICQNFPPGGMDWRRPEEPVRGFVPYLVSSAEEETSLLQKRRYLQQSGTRPDQKGGTKPPRLR